MHAVSIDTRGHSQNQQKHNGIFTNSTGGHHSGPMLGLFKKLMKEKKKKKKKEPHKKIPTIPPAPHSPQSAI